LFGEGGKIQTNSTCRNCGKELQAEWKACPYCGTAALELSAGSGRNAAGGWQTAGTSTSGNTPNNAEAYNDRGNAYYNKGEYDRAIADLNEAIRLDPNFVWAYNNRGNAYYNKGDIDRAIADYSEAMRLDPNYAWAYGSRGLAYKNKSPKNQAIQDWEKAIQLDPNYQWAKDRLKEIRGW
jgi:tetratricopeptide (TPR) repeat protein